MTLCYSNHYFSYALPIPKAEAVAQETLAVWCSLASRLGVWALKAELEDLCFAVLQVLFY
jgi:(p)ppGpp synthase/HD superfamily hydrolase